jgi:hypothetical protein
VSSVGDVNLALQGHCPVALVTPLERLGGGVGGAGGEGSGAGASASASASSSSSVGILRDGTPAAGVARFRGRYYLCSSPEAMEAFAASPDFYLSRIRALALENWELIHALHIVHAAATEPGDVISAFRLASLPAIVHSSGDLAAAAALQDAEAQGQATGAGAGGGGGASGAGAGAAEGDAAAATAAPAPSSSTVRLNKKGQPVADAGVETPVHFVERRIDPRYEFSEWGLRRRAVQIANIRKCATHGIQTDASHFRRDNDTQVYLPVDSGTQTNTSVGTITDRVVQHVVGIRGAPEPFVEAAAANKAAGRPALPSSSVPRVEGPVNARVVQQTLQG